jgi:hypothetical protein
VLLRIAVAATLIHWKMTSMDPSLRIVTTIPVSALWNDTGELPAVRDSYLTRISLKSLLRAGPIQFVVADVGARLSWIEKEACFEFWKRVVEQHLADPNESISLDQFPSGLAYLASLWTQSNQPPIVLLEAIH